MPLGEAPRPFGQRGSVERDDLGYIDHRVLWQPGVVGLQQKISRRLGPLEITRQGDAYNGRKPTMVEGVALDHQHRAPESGLGTDRLSQVGPPDLTLMGYHSLRCRVCRAADSANRSCFVSSPLQRVSRASVTRSGVWRARNSDKARL